MVVSFPLKGKNAEEVRSPLDDADSGGTKDVLLELQK